jgi:zinc transport system substrate-binding protein
MLPLPYLTPAGLRHCLMLLALGLAACSSGPSPGGPAASRHLAVSIAPLKAIVQELAPDVDIHVLTPRGASPHTHEPKPSDAARAATALAVFYVDDTLDGWVAKLDAPRHVALFAMVPEALRRAYPEEEGHHDKDDHDHGPQDPHFWNDPLTVKATLGPLVEVLAELGLAEREELQQRAAAFGGRLDALDARLREELAPARGGKVAVFHHSIDYLLARYGIAVAGAVEPSPGQSAGPRSLHALAERLKAEGARAVFVEPQLSPQAALTVAEQAGIPVVEIDPEGGIAGRERYEELILFNAAAIRGAFE